ncbi:hypothetical protein [Sphaerimonospora mesophila]|uniref:hypothetical protein n=1 Tax=Sphaerimonospora mesophila TaxID=37483 RepID=UPI0006E161BC
MSGCCGQGPVIVTGANATPRLDVEAIVLCDVLPDGSTAATVLVEPVYDASTGQRVGTRVVDPATGADYVPQGTLGPCASGGGGTVSDCEQPTEPVATLGLCLPDGTPIAVTVVRDCAGVVAQTGWINLTTGAFSAGAPPTGVIACGDSRSIQVSGTFCDLNAATGEVLGLVLIEYSYAADGTISSVRLVDAVTGDTYTPTGFITMCPTGVEQPEQDLTPLCDTAGDGTITPFVRDYRRDLNGQIIGYSDYAIDGTPYTSTGTVGVCGDCTPPAPSPLNTGVRRVTGTSAQDLVAAFPGLQSVTLTVLSGSVLVTMTDGAAVPVPSGTSLTWSIVGDDDGTLAGASFQGADAASEYLLVWTYRP